jgi:di/tricarboxylate transporter
MEIALVLTLLVLAMAAFALEWLPVDVVTLIVLLVLLFAGILTPQEAFKGFGSDIIIILASVFVISGAMRETGVVDWLGQALERFTRRGGENSLLLALMGSVSGLSAFMNNTTVTAVMLAPISGLARRRKISPSKVLMPLAFASILGGTCTVIGTSTNVAVSGYLEAVGQQGIGFFELVPLGLILVLAGTAGMIFIGKRLLPDHPEPKNLTEDYGLQRYLSEVIIKEGSPLAGRTLRESSLGGLDLRVLNVLRDGRKLPPRPTLALNPGDVLLVSGGAQNLMKVRETEGIDIVPDVKFGDKELKGEDVQILEVLVTPLSGMLGRQIQNLNLPALHGITVLAVNRHGKRLREKLKTVRLEMGDLLLVRGATESMDALRASPDFAVFGEHTSPAHRGRKGLLVLAFLAVGVTANALGMVPLSAGLLGAAVAAVLIRAMPMHRVYRVIEWRLLVLIAGMMAFGLAMEKTHAAEFVASGIVAALDPFGMTVVLAGFVVLAVLLTQPMSNAAAALVILPIALSTAEKLGVSGRPFAIAITYAASVSLIAPFEPSSLLVYGPGKYRFVDFIRVGGILTLILLALIVTFVPIFWPIVPAAGP